MIGIRFRLLAAAALGVFAAGGMTASALAVGPTGANVSGLAASGIGSCPYITDSSHSFPYCSNSSQQVAFDLPGNTSSGVTNRFTFNYPGDNSMITFTADLAGLNPSFASAAGFNVFDKEHETTPITATTLNSQVNNVPSSIQFSYSSGTSGPVTVELFNWTPDTLHVLMSQSGLVPPGGGVATPLTLQMVSGGGTTAVAGAQTSRPSTTTGR